MARSNDRMHITPDAETVKNLDALRKPTETYASVVKRLAKARLTEDALGTENSAISGPGRYISIGQGMRDRLDSILQEGETYHNAIDRLVDEHLTAEKQREMTPLGSTAALRIKPSTLEYLTQSACVGDDYDDVVTRVLQQRDAYRIMAQELVEEGQRLQHNTAAMVANLKTMIRELIAIDVVVNEAAATFDVDVDEVVTDAVDGYQEEGDE